MSSSGSNYIPWSKAAATIPEGINVPMCFYGSLCKFMKSEILGDDYGMRFFMCENYEYDPPKRYGKDRAKVAPEHMLFVFVSLTLCYDSNFYWTKSPLPLCDFVQWFDTVQS